MRQIGWTGLWPESGAANPIPALDGLRAVAVLLVLVYHAWNKALDNYQPGELILHVPISYGRTGVQLFFVLSGFLLFLPYARWLFGLQPRPSAFLFYKRRILRVGPAYWASLMLLLCGISLWGFAFEPQKLPLLMDGALHAVFVHNASPDSTWSLNGVFWTMAIEVQFYVLLPLLGFITMALARRMGIGTAVMLVMVSLVAIAVASVRLATIQEIQQFPLSTFFAGQPSTAYWLVVFGCGIVCSVLYVYLTQVRPHDPRHAARVGVLATAIAAGALGIGLAIAFVPGLQRLPVKNMIFGCIYAAVLVGVLFGAPAIRRIVESRPMRFLGLISYSLYIWHAVVLELLSAWNPALAAVQRPETVIARFVLGLAISVPVAYVSYQLTERPFLRVRKAAHDQLRTRPRGAESALVQSGQLVPTIGTLANHASVTTGR